MPKEIFDQDRPRSAKARRLDDAFAGCEEWTVAPPSPRRAELGIAPWLSSSGHGSNRAASTTEAREQRAA